MKKFVALMVVGLLAGPAMAGTIATPHVAGDFQGWDAGANPMTETGVGTDVWTADFTGMDAGSRHEFKITDGTWDNALPLPGNSWLFADGSGNITITYDGNTYADGWSPSVDRMGLSTDPATWTAAGDWQSQVGGGDWDNANPFTAMAPQGGGIYSLTAVLTPGDYNWKAAVTGSWDALSWDARSVNSANQGFSTTAWLDTVTFSADAFTGVVSVAVTPEPGMLALLGFGGLALLRRRR